MMKKLFSSYPLGTLSLPNRMVMAPLTRSRAFEHNAPNELMATYYAQRATAGLIITEGTSPSPNGLGYARIPGAYSAEQTEGWRLVADAVHREGGRIFMQIMHTGRIGHLLNMPPGAYMLAPSAVTAAGQIWTPEGMKDHPQPKEMSPGEIELTIREYVVAAENTMHAGLDGVELHAANGYLFEQFLNPASNQRTDAYGGSVENRCRFLLETARAVGLVIGIERVGVRLSPYGIFNDMSHYPEIEQTYEYLARELDALGVGYLHIIDQADIGADPVPKRTLAKIRSTFKGTLIRCGGFTLESAEEALQNNTCDLVAFGRPFISNPDLVRRFQLDVGLNVPDTSTYYAGTDKGYTDYPFLSGDGDRDHGNTMGNLARGEGV